MPPIFMCPECCCEHDEPARADFVLAVLCQDCALESGWNAARRDDFEIIAAAA